ncbi:sulfotransferase domain-containing protein [Cognaticolwellia mytili]|uniref:sulfotransferase domain-containing protein n=1 Tax=Cognaticolwellia mytili TaxID=1888913 RepID=UPI000A16DF45|nr:sulfotransferase domain-containing protein [Cognaticolwellia mytili]
MKNYACFIISTGRCGSQWLTRYLAHLSAQQANPTVVKHEPLGNLYDPLRNSPSTPLLNNKVQIEKHLNDIQGILSRGENYIETGFPCWRHIQWFKEKLKVPVKVIHLIRHPANTAISLLKLNAFVPPWLPHLPVKELFSPFAPEAKLTYYQQNWQQLSPFEKNLYYWGEVQLQALAYREHWQEKHWLQLSYEHLFTPDALNKLAHFLNITDPPNQYDDERLVGMHTKVDNYGNIPQANFTVEEVFHHRDIIKLAHALGYQQLVPDKVFISAGEKVPGISF